MFMRNNSAKKTESRLLDILRGLSESQADTLLAFAEFLAARQGLPTPTTLDEATSPPVPADIPRPEKESVVKAIKRLAATYPMLDRSKMLNETSTLMTQHVMHGRDVVEVIDELELVFRRSYEKIYLEPKKGTEG